MQDPGSTQNFNRYSYALGNPFLYTDPTGYSWWSQHWRQIATIALTVTAGIVIGTLTAGMGLVVTSVLAGAVSGFVGGFAGTLLNKGSLEDAFWNGVKGALVGMYTGLITAGILAGVGTVANNILSNSGVSTTRMLNVLGSARLEMSVEGFKGIGGGLIQDVINGGSVGAITSLPSTAMGPLYASITPTLRDGYASDVSYDYGVVNTNSADEVDKAFKEILRRQALADAERAYASYNENRNIADDYTWNSEKGEWYGLKYQNVSNNLHDLGVNTDNFNRFDTEEYTIFLTPSPGIQDGFDIKPYYNMNGSLSSRWALTFNNTRGSKNNFTIGGYLFKTQSQRNSFYQKYYVDLVDEYYARFLKGTL